MSGKSQGNLNFFKVQELSGYFANCQESTYVNVRELSGKGCHKPYSIQKCILC